MLISPYIYFKPVFEWLLHNSLLHLLLKNGDFLNTDISQGSVATFRVWWGICIWLCYKFPTESNSVKEFWKSANIWWSYGQELGVLFFLTHGVQYALRNMLYYLS